jgi:hypothetical protein
MKDYAYLISDPLWPPTLHEVKGTDPETDLVMVSPVNNPGRILYLYPEDLWIIASA